MIVIGANFQRDLKCESYYFFKSTCITCSVKTSVLFEMWFLQWHNVEVDDIGCNFAQKRLVVRLLAVLVKHRFNPYFSFFKKKKKKRLDKWKLILVVIKIMPQLLSTELNLYQTQNIPLRVLDK